MDEMKSFIHRHLFDLVHLKKTLLRSFGRKYYSQSGEDIILNNIFSKKEKGFYVDVGAYHPQHYSNTYLLYKRGWNGINIDPNPKSISLFKKYRKKDTNLQVGIALEESTLTYHMFNHQSCNTFSEEQKEEVLKKQFITHLRSEKVPCYPLSSILKKHAKEKHLDLLSIDSEGLDLQILKSNDWHVYKPEVIVVESEDVDFGNLSSHPIYKYLDEKGYALEAYTGLSMIFKRND